MSSKASKRKKPDRDRQSWLQQYKWPKMQNKSHQSWVDWLIKRVKFLYSPDPVPKDGIIWTQSQANTFSWVTSNCNKPPVNQRRQIESDWLIGLLISWMQYRLTNRYLATLVRSHPRWMQEHRPIDLIHIKPKGQQWRVSNQTRLRTLSKIWKRKIANWGNSKHEQRYRHHGKLREMHYDQWKREQHIQTWSRYLTTALQNS